MMRKQYEQPTASVLQAKLGAFCDDAVVSRTGQDGEEAFSKDHRGDDLWEDEEEYEE